METIPFDDFYFWYDLTTKLLSVVFLKFSLELVCNNIGR